MAASGDTSATERLGRGGDGQESIMQTTRGTGKVTLKGRDVVMKKWFGGWLAGVVMVGALVTAARASGDPETSPRLNLQDGWADRKSVV